MINKQFKKNQSYFYSLILILTFTQSTTCKFNKKSTVDLHLFGKNSNISIITPDQSNASDTTKTHNSWKKQKKKVLIIIYIAADNDLGPFAIRNIKQIASIGSNKHMHIAIHLDIRINNKKTTRRYYVKKNKLIYINENDPTTQQMDSGNPQTLISCCKWAIQNYPADNHVLILWNHGLAIDPEHGKIINTSELFTFNPFINKFELDRSIGFLDLISCSNKKQRAICWDDTTGNYLTNQKLEFALKTICKNYLNGGKFSIIGFDACLMADIVIANILKKYARIMIGSQEVEHGTGWPYDKILKQSSNNNFNKILFSTNIVNQFGKSYEPITNDYTLSAINLDNIDELEENIDLVSKLLIESLRLQKNNSVKKAIKISCNKLLCTHFEEPSFKDLHHLYSNLLNNLKYFTFIHTNEGAEIKKDLKKALQKGCTLIKTSVIANSVGKNLSKACGISIYLPERKILYLSYRYTNFAATNAWISFISKYLIL